MIPRSARSSTTLRPLHCLSAAWRDSARPAPWHAEANALFSAVASPTRMYEPVPMLPPMSTGWPTGRNVVGQAFVPGPEGPGGALAVNEQFALSSLDRVRFDLAGVVRDVEQKSQVATGKEMGEDAAARSGRGFRGWRARN